jgi:hypothetical protein
VNVDLCNHAVSNKWKGAVHRATNITCVDLSTELNLRSCIRLDGDGEKCEHVFVTGFNATRIDHNGQVEDPKYAIILENGVFRCQFEGQVNDVQNAEYGIKFGTGRTKARYSGVLQDVGKEKVDQSADNGEAEFLLETINGTRKRFWYDGRQRSDRFPVRYQGFLNYNVPLRFQDGPVSYDYDSHSGSDDPTTDTPTEWIEVEVQGNTRFIPVYQ